MGRGEKVLVSLSGSLLTAIFVGCVVAAIAAWMGVNGTFGVIVSAALSFFSALRWFWGNIAP